MNKVLKRISRIIPDKIYLKILFRIKMKKKLNLENPESYSEKLQWLKLHDRKTFYSKLVDKYEVKKVIKEMIGEEYVIPTIGVYDRFDEIDFDELPKRFVIKCTHDSGGIVLCNNKEKFNKKNAEEKIESSLKENYYYSKREWPYKDVKPRIIIEEYMEDENGELNDYKFFVFNGKVKVMFVATDRNAETETCFDFYDEKFNHLPFTNGHPNAKKEIKKPKNFEKMVELAEKIGKDIPHIRVDFYSINDKVYFGEITFFHWSGLVPFKPEEWDYRIGDMLELPRGRDI